MGDEELKQSLLGRNKSSEGARSVLIKRYLEVEERRLLVVNVKLPTAKKCFKCGFNT